MKPADQSNTLQAQMFKGRVTWYFHIAITHVNLKEAAKSAAGQIQGHTAAPTQNFNSGGVSLKVQIADLGKRCVRLDDCLSRRKIDKKRGSSRAHFRHRCGR
jgi:hypothetical protein